METFLRAQSPIDLHLHSALSDGTDSPTGVVREAHSHGVRTMALTDHDTTDGWAEARAACLELNMTFVPGAEISVSGGPGVGGMHLLAYLFDPLEPTLAASMADLRGGRPDRIKEMVMNLQEDFEISLEAVMTEANGAPPQRPHIAAVLVANGYATSTDEVFANILNPGGKYYIPTKRKQDILAAIRLINAAGGVAIIAHPTGRSGGVMPVKNLELLLDAGLAGFELDHRENAANPAGLERLREYARDYDLIVTGSSDYHGSRKKNRPGENTTAPHMLERIIERATGCEPTYPVVT